MKYYRFWSIIFRAFASLHVHHSFKNEKNPAVQEFNAVFTQFQRLITTCKYLSVMSMYQRSKIHLFCFQTRTNFQQSISVHVTKKENNTICHFGNICELVFIVGKILLRIEKKKDRKRIK